VPVSRTTSDPTFASLLPLIMRKGNCARVANTLHQPLIYAGAGLTVSTRIPKRQQISGVAELASRSHNRYLSMGAHSCNEPSRKATTTPANPASATAIWAAVDRASAGSIALD